MEENYPLEESGGMKDVLEALGRLSDRDREDFETHMYRQHLKRMVLEESQWVDGLPAWPRTLGEPRIDLVPSADDLEGMSVAVCWGDEDEDNYVLHTKTLSDTELNFWGLGAENNALSKSEEMRVLAYAYAAYVRANSLLDVLHMSVFDDASDIVERFTVGR